MNTNNQALSFGKIILGVCVIVLVIFFFNVEKNSGDNLQTIDVYELAFDDDELRRWIQKVGPEKILEKLLEDKKSRGCHTPAHFIGRAAHEMLNISPFREDINPVCQYGYFHGLIESFIANIANKGGGNTLTKMIVNCETQKTVLDKMRCSHGVGHGFMMYENYELPAALRACEQFVGKALTYRCYAGAFMENIFTKEEFAGYNPHVSLWINDDPHFPCNAFIQDPAYYKCYSMQPYRMLLLYDSDFNKVILECENAPTTAQAYCKGGIGYFWNVRAEEAPRAIAMADMCNTISKTSRELEECAVGALQGYLLFWGAEFSDKALEFCRSLYPKNSQDSCVSVAEYLIRGDGDLGEKM